MVRILFTSYPAQFILFSYLIVIFAGAYCMFIAERIVNNNIQNYFTSIYFAIVSCASIGYGDIAPLTTSGRFLICIFSLIGIVTLSLLVFGVQVIMGMSAVEQFSFK